jgi:hypothetical protein
MTAFPVYPFAVWAYRKFTEMLVRKIRNLVPNRFLLDRHENFVAERTSGKRFNAVIQIIGIDNILELL